MCFNISITKFTEYLEKRFKARLKESYKPVFHASAFTYPKLPIITNTDNNNIQLFNWGLIPFWVKNKEFADKIKTGTFNAKAETIFEKPSFKNSINKKRCLVLVDGFYEWHEYNNKKYPFYIKLKNNEAFALAGIWDTWINTETGEKNNTFSIITTTANELIEKIHNTKKRMPIILKKEDESKWVNEMKSNETSSFFYSYNNNDLIAYPVSKLIIQKNINTNIPQAIEKFEYKDLNF
jgi:putative SOS response-associated peptidase YedK